MFPKQCFAADVPSQGDNTRATPIHAICREPHRGRIIHRQVHTLPSTSRSNCILSCALPPVLVVKFPQATELLTFQDKSVAEFGHIVGFA